MENCCDEIKVLKVRGVITMEKPYKFKQKLWKVHKDENDYWFKEFTYCPFCGKKIKEN